MSWLMGLVASWATYALAYKSLDFWPTLGLCVLVQLVTTAVFWFLEEGL